MQPSPVEQIRNLIEARFQGSFKAAILKLLEDQAITAYREAFHLGRAMKFLPTLTPQAYRAIGEKVEELTMLRTDNDRPKGERAYRILPEEVRKGFIAGLSSSAFALTPLQNRRLA